MALRVVLLSVFFLIPSFILASNGQIVLSEIFFDPAGTDTGKEYVVLKNTGQTAVDVTGFDLYLDIAKYYTFSGFALDSGANVKINLRVSGTDSGGGLFRQEGSSNMGNTSGSIAVFSGTDHGKSTIVDFVQYGKPGKTWESAASKAGLWQRGEFVDLSGFEPGCLIKRISNNHDPGSWDIVCNKSFGGESSGNIGESQRERANQEKTNQREETSQEDIGSGTSEQNFQDGRQSDQFALPPREVPIQQNSDFDTEQQKPRDLKIGAETEMSVISQKKQPNKETAGADRQNAGIKDDPVALKADEPVITEIDKPVADPFVTAVEGGNVAFEKLPAHAASQASGAEKGGKSNYIFLLTSIIAGVALGFLAVALGRKFWA